MNNIIVYLEIEEGLVADVSLELLTKARSLANKLKCKLEALAIWVLNWMILALRFSHTESTNSILPMTLASILILRCPTLRC